MSTTPPTSSTPRWHHGATTRPNNFDEHAPINGTGIFKRA
ncbi:hypothetical protein LFAB_05825 [Lactiplantibacillus fabifermentans T30PCM01]|uniref:Uncharacterized protein n=1 Tax=Lactiplantibacillus fabifermentans T30PCM01 TaxID=1400520 RepID=W6T8K4_9LACO|nr:hypothetical protein LFAB_05825 [Lactiplantibacillus fabifermentans T30PCM01]